MQIERKVNERSMETDGELFVTATVARFSAKQFDDAALAWIIIVNGVWPCPFHHAILIG